jgi:hypothetical protein
MRRRWSPFNETDKGSNTSEDKEKTTEKLLDTVQQ